MSNFGRGQSVADACSTRIPREPREAPNPHYLPGSGEGSSDLATPFHPAGDGSPGASDGGGRGGGPPVHRGARHQQGAWRPTGARVLRLRPTSRPVCGRSGRSGRMVVSRRRAEHRLRSLGRFARQLTTRISCSPKLIRPLTGGAIPSIAASVPAYSRGKHDNHLELLTAKVAVLQQLVRVLYRRALSEASDPPAAALILCNKFKGELGKHLENDPRAALLITENIDLFFDALIGELKNDDHNRNSTSGPPV